MISLRRVLFASLLAGLVAGCQPKSEPDNSGDAKSGAPFQKKLKKIQEEPEGPSVRPK